MLVPVETNVEKLNFSTFVSTGTTDQDEESTAEQKSRQDLWLCFVCLLDGAIMSQMGFLREYSDSVMTMTWRHKKLAMGVTIGYFVEERHGRDKEVWSAKFQPLDDGRYDDDRHRGAAYVFRDGGTGPIIRIFPKVCQEVSKCFPHMSCTPQHIIQCPENWRDCFYTLWMESVWEAFGESDNIVLFGSQVLDGWLRDGFVVAPGFTSLSDMSAWLRKMLHSCWIRGPWTSESSIFRVQFDLTDRSQEDAGGGRICHRDFVLKLDSLCDHRIFTQALAEDLDLCLSQLKTYVGTGTGRY